MKLTQEDAEQINQLLKQHALRIEDRLDRLEGIAIATALAVRSSLLEAPDVDRAVRAAVAKLEEFLAHALPSKTSDALLEGFQIGRNRVIPAAQELRKD